MAPMVNYNLEVINSKRKGLTSVRHKGLNSRENLPLEWWFEKHLHSGDGRNDEWTFPYMHATTACMYVNHTCKPSNPALRNLEVVAWVGQKTQNDVGSKRSREKKKPKASPTEKYKKLKGHREVVHRCPSRLLIISFSPGPWELWTDMLGVYESRGLEHARLLPLLNPVSWALDPNS